MSRAGAFSSRVPAKEEQCDRDDCSENDYVDPRATDRMRLRDIDILSALDSLRCDLKRPSQDDCYRKTDDYQNYN